MCQDWASRGETIIDIADQDTVPSLEPDQLQLADQVLRRLHEQFRSFVRSMPEDCTSASAMARALNVDRTTCQRLVYLANRPYPGFGMLERVPGVRGLRQLVGAARRAGHVESDTLDALTAAVDRYESALTRLGGSQSALQRRLAATPGTDQGTPSVDGDHRHLARRQLFEAAAELTGRFSETWVAIYVYLPAPGGRVTVARVHGLIGHRARADAVPLTFHNFTSRGGPGDDPDAPVFQALLSAEDTDQAPSGVLPRFSSNPLPLVSARQPGQYLVQAIDPDPEGGTDTVDLAFGTRSRIPHPASKPPRIEEVWAMINFPARKLVFDVYLHRDLARACIPALDAHLWRPDFADHVGDRWQTRFSRAPRLELLGNRPHRVEAPWARHNELTEFLFGQLDVNPERMVGFRCLEDYPAWRTGYCMSFDFNAEDD